MTYEVAFLLGEKCGDAIADWPAIARRGLVSAIGRKEAELNSKFTTLYSICTPHHGEIFEFLVRTEAFEHKGRTATANPQ